MARVAIDRPAGGQARVACWTDQHPAVVERLRSTGEYRADGRRVPAAMRPAFQWLRNEMRARVSGAEGRSLIWLTVNPMLRRRSVCDWACSHRGYLCSKTHITPGKDWLQLSVDRSRLLLSDFDLWNRYVIHYRCVPADEDDQARWDEKVRGVLGLPPGTPLPAVNKSWTPALVHEIAASWTRIFDPAADRPTQATVESLRIEDLVDFVPSPNDDDVPVEYRHAKSTYIR